MEIVKFCILDQLDKSELDESNHNHQLIAIGEKILPNLLEQP